MFTLKIVLCPMICPLPALQYSSPRRLHAAPMPPGTTRPHRCLITYSILHASPRRLKRTRTRTTPIARLLAPCHGCTPVLSAAVGLSCRPGRAYRRNSLGFRSEMPNSLELAARSSVVSTSRASALPPLGLLPHLAVLQGVVGQVGHELVRRKRDQPCHTLIRALESRERQKVLGDLVRYLMCG